MLPRSTTIIILALGLFMATTLASPAWAQGAAGARVVVRGLQLEGVSRLEQALTGVTAKRAVGHILSQPALLEDPSVHAVLTAYADGRLLPEATALASQDAAVMRVLTEIGANGTKPTSTGKTLMKQCSANVQAIDQCFDLLGNIQRAAEKATTTIPDVQRIAAIDIGSNNVKLTVADVITNDDAIVLRVIHREKLPAAFGQGLGDSGEIRKKNFNAGLTGLQQFAEVIDGLGVDKTVAVGTSALRRASNGRTFIQQVKKTTGIEIEVIGGDVEARTVLSATARDVPVTQTVAAIDIGGGSAEIVFGNAAEVKKELSLPLGNRRLFEGMGLPAKPTTEQVAALDEKIAEVFSDVEAFPDAYEIRSTGSGDIAVVARKLSLGHVFDDGRIVLTRSDLQLLFDYLRGLSRSARAEALEGSSTDADHVLVELRVIIQAMRHFHIEVLHPMDVNLRHGLLVEGIGVPRGTPIRIE